MIPKLYLWVPNTGKFANHIFQDNKALKDSERHFVELPDAYRHSAPQDACGYRASSPLKNVGTVASDTRVPSSRTCSSS